MAIHKFAAAAILSVSLPGFTPQLVAGQEAAFEADDECLARDDVREGCALGAFQLRANRKALEAELQAQRLPPGPPPDEPPGFAGDDDDDDEEENNDDDDDGKKDEDKSEAPAPASGAAADWGECNKDVGCGAESSCLAVTQYYSNCVPNDQIDAFKERLARQRREQHEHEREQRRQQGIEEGVQDPLDDQEPLPKAKQVGGTNPVIIKGNFLYDSKTGSRFFAKGVAYNPRNMVFDKVLMKKGNCTPGEPIAGKLDYGADPSAENLEDTWKEALNAIAVLGANTVRLYNIDPEISHKKFMDYAASLGLYVIIPLTRHDWGYLPAGSPSPHCYTDDVDGYGNVGTNLLISAKMIVKEFSQYDNTLLFTVANEMTVADRNGYAAFPCVKALTRDIHRYQKECNETMRRVPLIYADMDMGPPYRELVGRYLSCETESADDAVDAYGLNVYSWCDKEFFDDSGKASFEFSPYSPIREEFKAFTKPLLFTEFGCTQGEFMTDCPYRGGRTFPDVKTFFNEFKEILSGGVAFEFSMEDNQYGLALTPGFTSDEHNDGKFYYLDAYFALQKEFSKYNVSSAWDGAVTEDCDWTPDAAHKLSQKRKQAACPKKSEVASLFRAKGVDSKPNWHKLPPTPEGAHADALATCPEYSVSPSLLKEASCHFGA